jgi:hypothetical protein
MPAKTMRSLERLPKLREFLKKTALCGRIAAPGDPLDIWRNYERHV